MTSHDLTAYIDLIRSFLTNHTDSATFERAYLKMFKNDLRMWDQEEYEVLNDLFGDVDAYCSDPNLRGPGDLDEQQLRERAEGALERLSVLARSA